MEIASGGDFTVLLMSNGDAHVDPHVSTAGMLRIQTDDREVRYVHVAAGGETIGLLRSDGAAEIFGCRPVGWLFQTERWYSRPTTGAGVTYTQMDVEMNHAVLLQSDGRFVALATPWQIRDVGQRDVPALRDGLTYARVSAGIWHTVLLLSNGDAVACGANAHGQCDIPPLDAGCTYTDAAAGAFHTALCRSDGRVLIFGQGGSHQPELEPNLSYVAKVMPTLVLQATLEGRVMRFRALSGEERWGDDCALPGQ